MATQEERASQLRDRKKARLDQQVLDKLGELGGKTTGDEDVLFEGDKLVLPAGMTYRTAQQFLATKEKAEESSVDFTRVFNFRPWDGAYCTNQALKRYFGSVGHRGHVNWFGGEDPPQMITINVDVDKQEQIPWGRLSIPVLPKTLFNLHGVMDREFGPLFAITAEGPRKFRSQIEGVFRLVEEELKTNSMYRGKAFDGQTEPRFVDLSRVDPNKVIYTEEVQIQLDANVNGVLDYSAEMRGQGLPLKRSVLIYGPYGTGKTLAAFLTAQRAIKNEWTFIYARPAKDDLMFVMQTARLYQPAVVFFEDMDTVASATEHRDQITEILDAFDGITAKGTEILAILTTNHPEKIQKGMVRPGRLDAVIKIDTLDSPGIERMIKAIVPQTNLDPKINYEKVGESMKAFKPAFIKEAIDRTVRYAIVRGKGHMGDQKLTTSDFTGAAKGLEDQLALMEGAQDTIERDPLSTMLERITKEAATQAVRSNVQERVLVPVEDVNGKQH